MTCVCADDTHCFIDTFVLEGASCLPEQAINYEQVRRDKDEPAGDDDEAG